MPTYQIDLPGGASYQIDSEKELSDTEAYNAAMHTHQQQAQGEPSRPRTFGGHLSSEFGGGLEDISRANQLPGSPESAALGAMGGMRALTSPITAASRYAADVTGGNLAEYLAPKIGSTPAALIGTAIGTPIEFALGGGLGLANAAPRLASALGPLMKADIPYQQLARLLPEILQRTGRAVMSPGAGPVRAAESTQAGNIAANTADRAAFEQALGQHQQQQAALQAYQLQQQQAQQLSQAARAEQLTRVSDKEQALMEATRRAAPATTTEQAYAFMNQGMPMPPVAVPKLTKAADEALKNIELIPPSLQPSKIGKVAGELGGPEAAAMSQLPPGFSEGASPEAMQQVLQQLKAVGNAPTLDKLQGIQQGLGRLTRSPDPRVSGVAKHLYRNMMGDLEEASKTVPEAGQFLAATKIARQNIAAEDLADFMTNHGTRVKNGQILIQPDKLAQELRKDDPLGLSRSLRPEALADIQQALEDVFKVKTAPQLKPTDIISAPPPKVGPRPKARQPLSEGFEPKRAEGILARHPFITGGVAGSYLGVPHAIGIGVALLYPRMIFRAAVTPTGRKFIRSLYAQVPPMANDMARMGALVNFLRSQGERDIEAPPELVQWQQQQAQAQAQAQQQQQQQVLMQMLQQRGGEGGKQK